MALDITKLVETTGRIEATDAAAVTALNALRESNKATAAQLADVSRQLAELQAAGGDTSTLQVLIDDIVARLNASATAVEGGLIPAAPPADPANDGTHV